MKKAIVILILLFIAIPFYAQDPCDCKQNLRLLRDATIENYAGYQYKMSVKGSEIDRFYKDLLKESEKNRYQNYNCARLLDAYVAAFEDKHTRAQYLGLRHVIRNLNEEQKEKLFTVITENLPLSMDDRNRCLNNIDDKLVGLYVKESDTCLVLQDKTLLRDYVGVLWSTHKNYWKKGDVKFEIKANSKQQYDYYYYDDNHSLSAMRDVNVTDKIYDWVKVKSMLEVENNKPQNEPINIPAKTLYLRLDSFDRSRKPYIDKFLEDNAKELSRTSNLILDLRGNGGGSDDTFSSLIPYLYTNPIKSKSVDFFCSQNTVNDFIEYIEGLDEPNTFLETLVGRMKNNIGNHISLHAEEESVIELDTIYSSPLNIYLLIDRNCASSAEEFILLAKQSTKVTTLGENTSGCLDFSNIVAYQGDENSPNHWWALGYASSISKRLPSNPVDDNGISPDVHLSQDINWLHEVYRIIETQKK